MYNIFVVVQHTQFITLFLYIEYKQIPNKYTWGYKSPESITERKSMENKCPERKVTNRKISDSKCLDGIFTDIKIAESNFKENNNWFLNFQLI